MSQPQIRPAVAARVLRPVRVPQQCGRTGVRTAVADPESPEARAARLAKLAALEQDLGNQFPVPSDFTWEALTPRSAKANSGATLTVLPDGSVLASGENPDTDTYTVVFDAAPEQLSRLRLVALTDASLGQQGPGRTPHGNFVLTEVRGHVRFPASEPGAEAKPTPLEFKSAVADFSQDQFPAEHVLDGKPKTGWAIHGPGNFNVSRTLTLSVAPVAGLEKLPADTKLRCSLTLAQNFGTQHTLGRFKLEAGLPVPTDVPIEKRRKEALTARLKRGWLAKPPTPVAGRSPVPPPPPAICRCSPSKRTIA